MPRIGFFGGTFDPPHNGHLELAKTALDGMKLDEVLWVITPQSPLKTVTYSTLEQRIAMVSMIISGLSGMVLCDVDMKREAPYYTVDTARLIRQRYQSEVQLYFILGGDSLGNLVKWHQAQELIFKRLNGLIVARRPGDALDMDSLETAMPGISSATTFLNMRQMDVSSWKIRRKVSQGDSIEGDVPISIADFITSEKLYRP